jgi:hypothetical protein
LRIFVYSQIDLIPGGKYLAYRCNLSEKKGSLEDRVFFRRWELTQLNLPVQELPALIHRYALFEFFKPVQDDVDFAGSSL